MHIHTGCQLLQFTAWKVLKCDLLLSTRSVFIFENNLFLFIVRSLLQWVWNCTCEINKITYIILIFFNRFVWPGIFFEKVQGSERICNKMSFRAIVAIVSINKAIKDKTIIIFQNDCSIFHVPYILIVDKLKTRKEKKKES